jgi:hypothetical protein
MEEVEEVDPEACTQKRVPKKRKIEEFLESPEPEILSADLPEPNGRTLNPEYESEDVFESREPARDSDIYLQWMEKFQYPPSPKEKKALNQMTDEEMKEFITKRIRYEIGRDREMTNHRDIWFKRIISSTNSDF